MALFAVGIDDLIEWVHPEDSKAVFPRGEDNQQDRTKPALIAESREAGATIFRLRMLDPIVMSRLNDRSFMQEIQPDGSSRLLTANNQRFIDAACHGLVSVENFLRRDGSQVVLTFVPSFINARYMVLSPDSIRDLGPLLLDIGREVTRRNEIQREEALGFKTP